MSFYLTLQLHLGFEGEWLTLCLTVMDCGPFGVFPMDSGVFSCFWIKIWSNWDDFGLGKLHFGNFFEKSKFLIPRFLLVQIFARISHRKNSKNNFPCAHHSRTLHVTRLSLNHYIKFSFNLKVYQPVCLRNSSHYVQLNIKRKISI